MSNPTSSRGKVTIILGAGASRSVSYADEMRTLSPLDSDFFDLLQRLEISGKANWHSAFQKARNAVLQAVADSEDTLWQSMERMFYTLHLKAVLEHRLFPGDWEGDPAKQLIDNFTKAVLGLLRVAHGKRTCDHHRTLFQRLRGADAIVTFNYDLVAERALKDLYAGQVGFGKWLYGFQSRPQGAEQVPRLHKLHGSVGWKIVDDRDGNFHHLELRSRSWDSLDDVPGYLAPGPRLPLLLPYWEKRVELRPWRDIWARAAKALLQTNLLVIWGYSLPLTDLKARELFRMVLRREHGIRAVSVIDPSSDTRNRWRAMFVGQKFWPFEDINRFFEYLQNKTSSNALDFGPMGRA